MSRFAYFAPILTLLLLAACEQPLLEPPASSDSEGPLFAKGGKGNGGKPGGGDSGEQPLAGDTVIVISLSPRRATVTGPSLWFMDAEGNKVRALSDADEIDIQNYGPLWSPDGTQFVFHRSVWTPDGWVDQWRIATANPAENRWDVEAIPFKDANLYLWSSVGKIVYVYEGDVWTMNPDGSEDSQLTFSGDIITVVWSPDASLMLTDMDFGHGIRIYDLNCTGSCTANVLAEYDQSVFGLGSVDIHPRDWAHTRDEVLMEVRFPDPLLSDYAVLDLSNYPAVDPPPIMPVFTTPEVDEYDARWTNDDSQIAFIRWSCTKRNRCTSGLVIRDINSGAETEIAEAGASGFDWRPTP